MIAGLVKAPSHYSPTADAEAAVGRASVVLDVMAETGKISRGQRQRRPIRARVKIAPEPQQNSVRYFTDWALPQLEMLIDESEAAARSVDDARPAACSAPPTTAIRANAPGDAQGALVSLDRDGAVRAMVGGKDYVASIYNRATQATRQPGSAFKLFVYLAALEAGYTPDDMVVDEPVTIDGWSPRNNSGAIPGEIDAAHGLRLFDQHDRGEARPGSRLRHDRRHGAALRHHHADQHPSRDGARHVGRAADRHDPGLRLGRRARASP